MTTYETLDFTRDGYVGWLRLNRPDKLNSFTVKMWREMRAIGEELREDPEIRALVVIGNGRAFSSGIDTTVFTGGGGADAIQEGDDAGTRHNDPQVDGIMRTQEAYSWLADAQYPTIAAVRGYALGAGLQCALACDIRVFAHGTSVGLLEHKYGILPDLGGTQRLPRVVGANKAKELIWTAARIDAEEAYRIGLCERLVDDAALEDEVTALATAIAGQPPLAVQGAKRAVDAAARLPVNEGLVVEAEEQAVCLQSADMREAITAFVEKRTPNYSGK
jgi:enoyl-CoA hydratase/carnithine racemase